MLRSRKSRGEEPLDYHVPDPIVTPDTGSDPEYEAVLADSVGLALLVVLETLEPAERVAFVLHDMFAVPFSEIATLVDRAPDATRQLASRARRRVRGAAPESDTDLAGQREVAEAFFAASRDGDFEALCAVLDPEIELRADGGKLRSHVSTHLRGAEQVAAQALMFRHLADSVRRVLVNGNVGFVAIPRGKPFSVVSFVVRHGRIAEINILNDPERLAQLDLSFLDEG